MARGFDVEVRITPRAGLLDPEGAAVEGALHSMDFEEVSDLRVGRLIRFRVAADTVEVARERVEDMCGKLLANPVTEDFEVAFENIS